MGDEDPKAVLGRMERTLASLRDATDEATQRDRAVAFSSDAWHIADWVVKQSASDGALLDRLAPIAGTSPEEAKRLKKLQQWAIEASPNRWLHVCQVTATEAKHGSCRYFEFDEAVYYSSAIVSGIQQSIIATGLGSVRHGVKFTPGQLSLEVARDSSWRLDLGYPWGKADWKPTAPAQLFAGPVFDLKDNRLTPTRPVLKIRINREKIKAVEVFEQLYEFWKKFLNDYAV